MRVNSKKEDSVLLKRCPEKMIRTYSIAFGVSCVLTFITMLLTDGEGFVNTLFCDGFTSYSHGVFSHDDFMDFFNSIRDAGTKEVYKKGIIYPPLANLFFYVLSKMIHPELVSTPFLLRKQLSADTTCLTLYAVFVFVCVLFMVKMMQDQLSGAAQTREARNFPILMIFSYPVIYCIQRGNILLLAMVLSMFFVLYRNDERKWVRELSYLALAVAAGLKLYPAVFGLLLITDRKFKEALRLVVYGVVLTVLPFFFYDGFESINDLYRNLTQFSEKANQGVDYSYVTSNVIAKLMCQVFKLDLVDYLSVKSFLFSANMIGAILMFLILREEWQRVLCLSYLFMNLSSSGRTYILVFLLIPLTLFLKKGSFRKRDVGYFVCFFLLLLYIPCFYYPLFNTIDKIREANDWMWDKPNCLIASFTLHIMMVCLFVDMLIRISTNELMRLKKKETKQTGS